MCLYISQSKKLGTLPIFLSLHSAVLLPPFKVVKRTVWESLSNFQLSEGGGGGNQPSVPTTLSSIEGKYRSCTHMLFKIGQLKTL